MKQIRIFIGWAAASIQSTAANVNREIRGHHSNDIEIQNFAVLSNGHRLPLLGTGVGNLQHELITPQISDAIGRLGTTLIDTAQASHNDNFIVLGIRQGVQKLLESKNSEDGTEKDEDGVRHNVRSRRGDASDHGGRIVIDIVTKVWYTHLGYERTMRAVRDTINNLKTQMQLPSVRDDGVDIDIKLHILIHWPRCRHDISWMRCEEEEDELPNEIQKLGLPPHLHPDTAFIDSWRALQDLYEAEYTSANPNDDTSTTTVTIASIGVSNFNIHDLQQLKNATSTTITPHILQANVWSYLFDPDLTTYCHTNSIHIQAYNVMNGILSSTSFQRAPRSAEALRSLASSLSATPAQIVLRYLLAEGGKGNELSLVPRTTSPVHLAENSLRALSSLPDLTPIQRNTARSVVRGLLEGRDDPDLPASAMDGTELASRVRFINGMVEEVMHLFWLDASTGEEKMVAEIGAGEEVVQRSWPGHIFVAYSGSDAERRKEFLVENSGGVELQDFHVEF